MKVKTTEYGNTSEILMFRDHYVGRACMVSDTGITADANGKKIVPAGTIVSGFASGEVSADNTAAAEGVLLWDVDVTSGAAPGTMLIHGFVNVSKLPETPDATAIAALPMIGFLKEGIYG